MMDVATCAMAFRLLRMNGYDVSSGTSYSIVWYSLLHNFALGIDLMH